MSNQFAVIRQELEDFLREAVPAIDEYRLTLQVPTDDRGMLFANSIQMQYNPQGGAVKRAVSLLLSASVEIGKCDDENEGLDRMVYICTFLCDTINKYSRCGKLGAEIRNINGSFERGMDAQREPDDYFVWTFINFTMQYQDHPALRFEESLS